jgi:HD-GYP domain-containing protein (c-di-GMP phosphodiesterase class II)
MIEERSGIGPAKPARGAAELNRAELPRVRVPIRVKITVPYLILSLVLAIGAAYVVTQIIFDTIDERFTNQLIESGKLSSEWMVRQENDLLETLRLLAYTEGVAEAVQAGDAEALRALAFGLTAGQQEEAVEFLDAQGNLLLAMRRQPGGEVEEYDFAKDGDAVYRQWLFVEQVLAGRTDSLGDKYSGFVHAGWGDFFYVAGPVYDRQGARVGAVLVGKRLVSLVRQIREELLAHATLYGFDGQPLASTFLDEPALEPGQVDSVLANQDQSSLKRNLGRRRELNVSHIEYDEILGPWEGRGNADLGLLGVSLPKTFLVSASRTTRLQTSALVAAALFLVILMGVKVADIITDPLLGVVRASFRVAQGDLQVQVPPGSNDELAVLADSFNRMVASLYVSKMDLLQAYDSTIEGWSTALELRDQETQGHTQRGTELTLALARAMGMPEEALVHVRRGALLHDIGKMAIPDSILFKAGPLSEAEWAIMRLHPQYAYEMLWPIEYLRPALDIPYCHHERWDGTGYPRALKGEAIPLAARIYAVIDVWDAMRSDRRYRAAMPEVEVMAHIQAGSGTHFDPRVIAIFFALTGKPGWQAN